MGDENMEDAFREQVERKRREADAGDADAQNELGDFYYSGGPGIDKDYAESIKWYTKSALQGNVEAMYSLGWAYYSGEGATVNMLRAKDWFERAAAQQHKKACRNLGNILYGGVGGVAKDPSRAIALWEQASELGDAQAASLIGKLYTDGDKDTARDPEKGCRYLQVAADLGDGYAMFLLGCAYRAGNGVPCDAAAAKTWFDRAQDEAGIVDVELLFERGMEHYSGVGAEYSLSEAVKCFAAAAEGGHAIAMTFLCRLFFEGLARPGKGGGGAQDSVEGYEGPHYKISHEWGVKAYQKGETDVGYYLGLIHEMGHGPSGVDHQIAMHWYLTCIQNTLSGNHMYRIKSMVALGRCYYKGGTWDRTNAWSSPCVPQDPKRAAYWWHRAASEGPSAEAMNHLGDLYFSGVGVPRDREAAREWWEHAAELGNAEAVETLESWFGERSRSVSERLKLWVPMLVLAVLLGLLFLFFLYQFHQLAQDSWFHRTHGEDTGSTSAPAPPPPPQASQPLQMDADRGSGTGTEPNQDLRGGFGDAGDRSQGVEL